MSGEQKFNIIYAGAISSGFNEIEVKQSFVEKLKVPKDKVDMLFSGKRITLHKSLSKDRAEKWQKKLLTIGAESVVIPEVEMQPSIAKADYGDKIKNEPTTRDISEEEVPKPEISESASEADKDLEDKIRKAKALIAAQQMEQKLNKANKESPYKRLVSFSVVLIALVLFLYIYMEFIM